MILETWVLFEFLTLSACSALRFDPGVGAGKLPALRAVVDGRASLVTPGLYPAIIPTRAKPARISTTYGIPAIHGGDILSQQAEVSFFYPRGASPLYAAWDLYPMNVHC